MAKTSEPVARVEFVNAAQVHALSNEQGRAGAWAKYLAAVLADGPRTYADNANAGMEALLVDGELLPLVLTDGAEGTSETCSPYSHYISYTVQEVSKRNPRMPRWFFTAGAAPPGHLLRLGGIDRVVSVNNWLLSTNPSVRLDAEQVRAVTACLRDRYPGRAILWRSLNPSIDGALMECARGSGYRLLRSRLVYMVDSGRDVYRHANARRDLQFLKRTPCEIVSDPQSLIPYTERMAELFASLYLGKHSRLNTAYNSRFFALALASGVFEFRGFLADRQLAAFVSFFIRDQVMTAGLIGYDLNQPRSLGLYRLGIAAIMDEAASRGLRLNLSGGADSFKRFRGGVPVDEYEAVYDRHLSRSRRLPWLTLSALSRAGGAWRARNRVQAIPAMPTPSPE